MQQAKAALHLEGTDIRISTGPDGLVRIDCQPLEVTEIYYLFPEILDGAACAVTIFGEPGYFCGTLRDRIENKFQTDLLEQRERLEFHLVEREVSEEEFRAALACGVTHELFGDGYLKIASFGNRQTTLTCVDDRLVEKLLPYLLRRPWFEKPEKNVRSDPFVLPKFLAAAREGIHFNLGGKKFLGPDETLVAGIGPWFTRPVLAREIIEGMDDVAILRCGCDAEGNLKAPVRETLPAEEYLARHAGAYRPFDLPVAPILAGIGALTAAGSLAAPAPLARGAAGALALVGAAGATLVAHRARRNTFRRQVTLEAVEFNREGATVKAAALVRNGNRKPADNLYADLVLRDGEGATVDRAPVRAALLGPGEALPVGARFADPASRGRRVELVLPSES